MVIFMFIIFFRIFFEYPFYLPGPVVHLITLQIEILKYLENILTREQRIGKAITFNKVNDVARVW